MVAPITIEIVIHYYVTPSSVGDYRASKAFDENVNKLIDAGLLYKALASDRMYEANRDACEVYLDALCSVPLPRQEWIIPINNKKDKL